MGQVASCPSCNGRLSLRSELVGKRVVCPHCKVAFVAAVQNTPRPAPEAAVSNGGASAAATSLDIDFLADLSAATTGNSPPPIFGRAGGSPLSASAAAGIKMPPPPLPGAALGGPMRPKANKPPVELYIYGGAAAGIVLLLLVVLVLCWAFSGGSTHSGSSQNVKYGLTLTQRKAMFYELLQSVDLYGVNDKCRADWRRIEKQYGVNRNVVAKVLDEGFRSTGTAQHPTQGWRQPEFPPGTDAGRFAHFKEWIRMRGLTGDTDPLLSD